MPELLARTAFAGLGAALPAEVRTTAQVAQGLGVDPDWIRTRTGIEERRVAAPGQRLTDLAAAAGRAALADAGVAAEDVDLLLVATCSPDEHVAPASAQVAHALGAQRAGTVDLGAACTGFVAGLAMAAAGLESGRSRCVLLIGAEVLTRLVDPADRKCAPLFGDGAGAVVLAEGAAIGPVVLGSDGAHAARLFASRDRDVIEMDGQEVFRHAVERMAQAAGEAAEAAGVSLAEVDVFVFHQANARILQAVARRLGLAEERVVNAIARHGNTSAASIPLALAQAAADGRLHPGDRVLLAAFGAGFSWGGTVVTW